MLITLKSCRWVDEGLRTEFDEFGLFKFLSLVATDFGIYAAQGQWLDMLSVYRDDKELCQTLTFKIILAVDLEGIFSSLVNRMESQRWMLELRRFDIESKKFEIVEESRELLNGDKSGCQLL